MITSIHLRDFQGHADSLLEFGPGVNLIIGVSDSGKTSIFRALNWLVTNRPVGDEFIRWGAKATSVQVTFPEGAVGRVKGVKSNYVLDKSEVFSGFGLDVPEPIQKRLNLTPLNIQGQLDTPFLVGETPGGVARYLNQVINLERIDRSLANINATKKENDAAIRQKNNRLAEIMEALAEFPDLEAAEEFINDLEAKEKRVRELRYNRGVISAIITDIKDLKAGLARLTLPEGIDERLAAVITKIQRAEALSFTRISLTNLLRAITSLERSLKKTTIPPGVETRVAKVEEKIRRLTKLRERRKTMQEIVRAISLANDEGDQLNTEHQTLDLRLKEIMPDVCPLCGSPVQTDACS